MTLPSSGALSISAINTEFARGNNLNAYRGTTWYTDAGATGTFSAGAITMNEFYSKRLTSPSINLTVSANTSNYNLYTAAGSPAGVVTVNVTINSGVYCYASNTSNYGFRTGAFAAGSTITITNNGFITGMGGNGSTAPGGVSTAPKVGNPGFLAEVNCTINGSGQINGGGGGGGGSGGGSGGSGGGGRSFVASAGGVDASVGNGTNGSVTSGGNGNPSQSSGFASGETVYHYTIQPGGAGGNWGAAGATGGAYVSDEPNTIPGYPGAAGGASINRNGKTVSYSGVTLNGAVVG